MFKTLFKNAWTHYLKKKKKELDSACTMEP